ncbi:MAG: thiamine pyrophosphate-dependent dehydrogenase E1 component subunit alpha [Armatimonadota bacterium]
MDSASQIHIYRSMLRIRMVEERIADAYPAQEMRCPVHLCIGQEAIPVGVCATLAPTDFVLGGHRSHGQYLAKGGDLNAMIAELYGKATGCCRGRGGSMHLIDRAAGFLGAVPIVGSTIPIAAGVAFGSQMRGNPPVTAAFFGEGATEEGVFHESLNFAALRKLPIIFVCENNLYSVYSPLSVRQPAGRTVCQLAQGLGVACAQGDGNDVLEVVELARQAIERAREGEGPTLLELSTYRWREHCGPNYDNQIGYRTEEEFECWKARCPVCGFEERLRAEGLLDAASVESLRAEIAAELDAAWEFAARSPFPDPAELLDGIYAPERMPVV